MAKYELVFRTSAIKDLRNLPRHEVALLLPVIEALRIEPRPSQSQKLTASEQYRLRKGRYRILYEIEDQQLIITVVKIAHPKEAYR